MSEDTPTFDLTSDSAKDETPSDSSDEETTPSEAPKVELYYPTHLDPARQVSPTGVYLDDVQRIEAEKVRARIEGREPDLDNPPAVQGTPLQTAAAINHSLSTLSTHGVKPDVVL